MSRSLASRAATTGRAAVGALGVQRRRARAALIRRLLHRRLSATDASIVICSEPRSGSTWLMELFAQLPGVAASWEPLHPARGVVPPDWDLGWRPHVDEAEADPRLAGWFDDLFRFRIGNQWTLSRTTVRQAVSARMGVHKFVRASLLLPWMTQHLDLAIRPVYLVRHPLATLVSQVHTFRPGDESSDDLSGGDERALEQVRRWCEVNERVLNHPRAGLDWVIVHYEHLLLDPRAVFVGLVDELGLTGLAGLDDVDYRRASTSNFRGAFKESPSEQIDKWSANVDADLRRRAQQLLDEHHIVHYRSDLPLPTVDAPPG